MKITAFDLAMRYVNAAEVPGASSNPAVLAMLRLDNVWPTGDDVPWCSAFVNWIAWNLHIPRSKKLNAKSWLDVGTPIHLEDAVPGWDVVVLDRTDDPTAGHVGFFARLENGTVWLLGGNQGDRVCVASFSASRVAGVRRLYNDV